MYGRDIAALGGRAGQFPLAKSSVSSDGFRHRPLGESSWSNRIRSQRGAQSCAQRPVSDAKGASTPEGPWRRGLRRVTCRDWVQRGVWSSQGGAASVGSGGGGMAGQIPPTSSGSLSAGLGLPGALHHLCAGPVGADSRGQRGRRGWKEGGSGMGTCGAVCLAENLELSPGSVLAGSHREDLWPVSLRAAFHTPSESSRRPVFLAPPAALMGFTNTLITPLTS